MTKKQLQLIIGLIVLGAIAFALGTYFTVHQSTGANDEIGSNSSFNELGQPHLEANTPSGWFRHELPDGRLLFSKEESFNANAPASATFATGLPFISLATYPVRIDSIEDRNDWLKEVGLYINDEAGLVRDFTDTSYEKFDAVRVLSQANGTDYTIDTLVIFPNMPYAILVSQFPYREGSDTDKEYKKILDTFSF